MRRGGRGVQGKGDTGEGGAGDSNGREGALGLEVGVGWAMPAGSSILRQGDMPGAVGGAPGRAE